MKTHHKVGAILAVIGALMMAVGFYFNQYTQGMVIGLVGLAPFFLGVGIVTSPIFNNQSYGNPRRWNS